MFHPVVGKAAVWYHGLTWPQEAWNRQQTPKPPAHCPRQYISIPPQTPSFTCYNSFPLPAFHLTVAGTVQPTTPCSWALRVGKPDRKTGTLFSTQALSLILHYHNTTTTLPKHYTITYLLFSAPDYREEVKKAARPLLPPTLALGVVISVEGTKEGNTLQPHH